MVVKSSKKDVDTAAWGFEALLELCRLRVAIDLAVFVDYRWQDNDLEHDFQEL